MGEDDSAGEARLPGQQRETGDAPMASAQAPEGAKEKPNGQQEQGEIGQSDSDGPTDDLMTRAAKLHKETGQHLRYLEGL